MAVLRKRQRNSGQARPARLARCARQRLAALPGQLAQVPGRGARRLARVRAEARASLTLPAVRLGVVASWLIVLGSFTPAFLPEDSGIPAAIGLSWMQYGAGRALATVSVLAGVALLVFAWLSLRPRRAADGTLPAVPLAPWWLWSLPFLLAPPLFSRDAYSYAAQGLIVDRGMDPYLTGPISVPGAFADQVDSLWLHTPSPYGPLALQTQHLIVDLTFGNAYLAAVAMRLPAIISMLVIARYLPPLAERLGGSAPMATWLGVLNPLVLLHLVGGAHNDAMAIALVVVALHAAAGGRWIAASLAIAAGAGFKQTAVLALVGVAGLVARRLAGDRDPAFRDYVKVAALTGLTSLAAFATITLVSGLGWGWIASLSVPLSLRSMLAPFTFLGSVGEALLRLLSVSPELVTLPVTVMHIVALAVMAIGLAWAAFWMAPRRPAVAAIAAFAFFVVCGPVLHPWYVLPLLVLLGLVPVGDRLTRAAIALSLFLTAYSAFDVAIGNGGITVALALGIAAIIRLRSIGMIAFSTPGVFEMDQPPQAVQPAGPAVQPASPGSGVPAQESTGTAPGGQPPQSPAGTAAPCG